MARVLREDEIPKSFTKPNLTMDFALDSFGGELPGTGAVPSDPQTARKIVRKAEDQAAKLLKHARERANEILAKAEEERLKVLQQGQVAAEQLMAQGQSELENAFRVAAEDGRLQGHAEGVAQGEQELIAQTAQLSTNLMSQIEQLSDFKEKIIAQYEAEILELVLVLATKIVGFELSLNPNIILEVVKSGLKLLSDKRNIVVQLNPEELELMRKYRSEILEQIESIDQITFAVDENLIAGECQIQSESNLVDSRWRTKISNAAEEIWKIYKAARPDKSGL